MKRIPAILLTLLLGSTLFGVSPETTATEMKFNWVKPSDTATAAIRHTGEQAIMKVGDRFISEVDQVLAQKGVEEAIDVLHLKGYALPPAVPGSPIITAIKRTSLRVRSAANTPDKAEMAALQYIRRDLESGNSPPKFLMQHVEASADAPEEWRIYRPIGVTPACIACHGAAESMVPAVKAKLELLYPEDKAVNYAAREWRGVIRVSVTAAPVGNP